MKVNRIERAKKQFETSLGASWKPPETFEMNTELLQPWSTFVMKTKLPPRILEKLIKITDEIVENRESAISWGHQLVGQIEDEFLIEPEILNREGLTGVFLDVCKSFVIKAQCQADPFKKKEILKEEWLTQINSIWVVSQKDNEYNPIHEHGNCHISGVIYLKIPEYLPARKFEKYQNESDKHDGGIVFINNTSHDNVWGKPSFWIQPEVGDFFIFPASQQHQVYPFRTPDGKGERRSISFNASFSSKSEQDSVKKPPASRTMV